MKRLLLIFTLLSSLNAFAQNRTTLKGLVSDKDKEAIIGATILIVGNSSVGTVSDIDGRFSITLPNGEHTLSVSFLGYETSIHKIEMPNQTEINIILETEARNLDEVIVSSISNSHKLENTQIGVEKIDIENLEKTPSMFGEMDIVKSITLLPGVKTEGDGSSGFQVRGGTAMQNLILLDDAPVYNAGHIMGIFSVFNSDALTNASLYKGQVPAQFGGASSAIFDISTKAGNMKDHNFSANIGLLSAKVMAEGPILEDKVSFFVSARRSYFDIFLGLSDKYDGTVMNFYDINTRIDYKINNNDRLSFSLFKGQDNMGLNSLFDMGWGNTSTSLNWFHRYKETLTSNTSFIWSDYDSENSITLNDIDNSMNSFIKNYALKHEYNWTLSDKHQLKLGLQTSHIDLKSADWKMNSVLLKEQRQAWENNIWINDEYKINNKIALSAGLRLNSFSVLGGAPYYQLDDNGEILNTTNHERGDIVDTYFNLEPRLSLNYRVRDNQSLKLGYSRNTQHIHALRNSTMSMPFDRYTMTSNILKPQISDQVSLGYIYLTPREDYEFSVESYYKNINNIYDYKDGKSFNSALEVETLLLGGKGRSYGLEFLSKKNAGKLTGWIGYTLSWTENKIDGINNNNWYTASNDRRHDISIVGIYELSKHWTVSATWLYNTGQALTAPSSKYEINGETIYYYAERNGYRAPNYHRLDLSFNYTKKHKRHTSEWNIGIYNLYNRYNPYMITFENDPSTPTGTKTMQTSLFGMLPSISYGIRF